MVFLYLMTVAEFHFPSHIPISSSCEHQTPSCQDGKSSPNSTQHLTEVFRLKVKLNNMNPTQQLSYMQAVRRDTTCQLWLVLCHHPLSPPVTQGLPWHLHLRHNLRLLNFHHSVQCSSSTDFTMTTQQVWVYPLDPLPVCRRAGCTTRDVRQDCLAAMSQLISQHLNCSAFQGTGEGKMKENSHSKE